MDEGLVFASVINTYVIIILHGSDAIPFSLGDAPLVALIVTGLGSSLGLVLKRIAEVMSLLPQAKTGL